MQLGARPVYGDCDSVSQAFSLLLSKYLNNPAAGAPAGMVGTVSCAGSPGTTFLVNDNYNNGASLACYNGGTGGGGSSPPQLCAPGAADCPCVYGPPVNGKYAVKPNSSTSWGLDMCVVCPPATIPLTTFSDYVSPNNAYTLSFSTRKVYAGKGAHPIPTPDVLCAR